MRNREIEHAALLWFAVYQQRLAITSEKRQVDKALKAAGNGWHHALSARENELARQLTPTRRKELMALRKLAKACAGQRSQLDCADVIDVEMKQLAGASTTPIATERT